MDVSPLLLSDVADFNLLFYITFFGAPPPPSQRSAGVVTGVIVVHPHSVLQPPAAATLSSSPALFCSQLMEASAEGSKNWHNSRQCCGCWYGVVVVGCMLYIVEYQRRIERPQRSKKS